MKGLTKGLLGVVAGFALVAAVVRFWPAAPPAQPAPTVGSRSGVVATSPPGGRAAAANVPVDNVAPIAETGPVKISILTTDTKAQWLGEVTKDFNAAGKTTETGRPIQVEMLQVSGPDEMKQAVLEGSKLEPVLWSPGDASWIEQANQLLKDRGQQEIVKGDCPSIVWIPTGFAMWRPMAEAMGWPDRPIGWKQIVELAGDPRGWATYGHPEWGQFKFGHSHPEQSTTGFNMLASLAYAAVGKTNDLTPQDVKSDAVKDAFGKIEKDTYHYGLSTSGLLNLMAQRGPGYLHAATTSETAYLYTVIKQKEKLQFPWAFIFPAEGTFWSDNPTCILQGSWIGPEQRNAAKIYRDFLLEAPQQDKAVQIGLRPAVASVPLHAPIALDNGTDPRVTPQKVPPLAGVSGGTNAAIIDLFKETKKKATIAVLMDTSRSMEGVKIKNAVAGSVDFLTRLHRDDEIEVYTFADTVNTLQPAGRVGDVAENLSRILSGLFAQGNTTLYDAVCTAALAMDKTRAEHEAAGEKRLYGIVLLSDGKDTNSKRTQNDMFACLPTGEDVEGIRVYTIAYGDDADKDLLTRIANRTNGKTFAGTPENIKQVYLQISAEQ